MQTRSQTKKQKTSQNDEVNIFIKLEENEIKSESEIESNLESELEFIYDFDYASECWKSNKKYVGNGCYKYMCQSVTKKGKPCVRTALHSEINCKMHLVK